MSESSGPVKYRDDSCEVLEQTEQLLELLQLENRSEADLTELVFDCIENLRTALTDRDDELAKVSEQSDAMAQAQADAIVRSAEIIDELERTKKRLSEARSAAEEAARDTQRLADTVFERTNDGVLVIHNGTCVACNENALDLLSCQRDEVIGGWPKAFNEACHDDGTAAEDELDLLFCDSAEREARSIEVRLPKRDQTTYWAEITVSSFSMKDAGHLLVVVRDISSRKQFEAELRRHRDFLNNIINAVPDQLSVTTINQELVVANDAFCSAHGVDRSDVLGKRCIEALDTEMLAITPGIKRELSSGACNTSKYSVAFSDDSQRTMSVKRSMFQDECSGEQYVVAAARDITEDRLREDRLRLLASVFNSASEGVAILSPNGQIGEANPAFVSMLQGDETEAAQAAPDSLQSVAGVWFADVLELDVDDFDNVLRQVTNGLSWSGKGRIRGTRRNRSCWVSISPSLETNDPSTRIIALVSDITELENTQRKLRWQALYDNLTGLPNRRFFRDHLEQALDESRSVEDRIAVCFLDLDDFKHVNDSAGHEKGDQLLQSVAARIQQTVPKGAFVARFGGDEFAVIFTGLSHEVLTANLNGLIDAFQEPFDLGDMEASVGLSIGVTQYPMHADNVEGLMCNADIAMYAAKASGKNRVCFFDLKMQAGVDMRQQVQSQLRQAIADGDLTLAFQPKVCAKSRQPAGCEALVRWRTNDGTFVPPSEFIPIAEQTGLITHLGMVVFELAAEQACKWFDDGIEPSVAVNVSAHQIRHPRFVDQLMRILERTGGRPEWFELEITEHAMMDDAEHASNVISELTSHGFCIAIDDFGTGFSSLSYLKNFRIQTLKIDLSFVQDMVRSPKSEAVVRSIISLGQGLDLTIVAEGIETAEQARLLTDAGCTLLQGYYFARPMPEEEYREWLTQRTGS